MKQQIMIDRVSGLGKRDFYENFVHRNQPVIITDITRHWKALNDWDFDYFKNNFGGIQAGTMMLDGEKCDVNTYSETAGGRAEVAAVITALQRGFPYADRVIASPLESFPKKIKQDYVIPEYCAGGKFLRSRIYIGPGGVVTPLHQDLPENLYVMVKGKKRIILYPPEDKKYLYPNSLFSRHPNFSRTDPERPDYQKFPKSKYAQPCVVELCAGEALFIPSFWWHHLRNLEPSISINFWWSRGWKLVLAWTAAAYKKRRNA